MTYYAHLETPAGPVLLVSDGTAVTGIHWKVFKRAPEVQPDWIQDKSIFSDVIAQLDEYFTGKRQTFDFTFKFEGTEFQKQVWNELVKIPFGSKTSYQKIASTIGRPKAVRAVGTAVGSNPISIVVPCHRVLTSNHMLGGYAGGLEGKMLLLTTERIDWKGDRSKV
jgi:methylated-DNA-[protein]-cysteine S-methyltransferase